VTLHWLHTAPRLWAHRHCDQWDPVTNGLLTHVSPFSSPSTPPLCPRLTALGMGAVGPSPCSLAGLEGLQLWPAVSAFPPPFLRRLVPCAFSRPNITMAHPSFASLQHTLVLVPYQGTDPWPPAHNAASPCGHRSPLFGLAAPSLQLFKRSSRAVKVHAYWVQSIQQDSGSRCVHPFR